MGRITCPVVLSPTARVQKRGRVMESKFQRGGATGKISTPMAAPETTGNLITEIDFAN